MADSSKDILCPFLRSVQPDVSGIWKFTSDLSSKGKMDRIMALFVAFDVTKKQKGLWAALTGQVPDLYRLDQVPGVSHPDLYRHQLDEVKEHLEKAVDSDGFVTLQDVVEAKKFVADKVGVKSEEMMDSSKFETVLLFLGSGGDLETNKVKVTDLMTLLQGQRPANAGSINVDGLTKGMKLAWSS